MKEPKFLEAAVEYVRAEELDDSLLRKLISPYLSGSSSSLISETNLATYVIRVDGKLLPIVVNDGRGSSAYISSVTVNYVKYAKDYLKREPSVVKRLLVSLLGLLEFAAGPLKIDRVVYVNNWHLGSGPWLDISPKGAAAVRDFLRKSYPGYAIVFKHCSKERALAYESELQSRTFRMFNRLVYIFSPGEVARKGTPSRLKQDIKLLKSTKLQHVELTQSERYGAKDLLALYYKLYFDKYSEFSARYTEEWFERVLFSGGFCVSLLLDEGMLASFSSYYNANGMLVYSVIGHDPVAARENGYYRASFSSLLKTSIEADVAVNMSSGQAEFKRTRGCTAVEEYDYVVLDGCGRLKALWYEVMAFVYNRFGPTLFRKLEV